MRGMIRIGGPTPVGIEIDHDDTELLTVRATMEDGKATVFKVLREEARRLAIGLLLAAERDDEPGYKCARCGKISKSSHDFLNKYCGHCHRFEDSID